MNNPSNLINNPENHRESTYALLLHSEERSRNVFEIVIYPLLIIAICQFVFQAVDLPSRETKAAQHVAAVSDHLIGSLET